MNETNILAQDFVSWLTAKNIKHEFLSPSGIVIQITNNHTTHDSYQILQEIAAKVDLQIYKEKLNLYQMLIKLINF